jgi:hypothetical protein
MPRSANGRRTDKKRRVPAGESDGPDFDDRRLNADAHKHDHQNRHDDRRDRVHDDAQRAVVGVGVEGVVVSHLGDGQQNQQNEAHESGSARSAGYRSTVFADAQSHEAGNEWADSAQP